MEPLWWGLGAEPLSTGATLGKMALPRDAPSETRQGPDDRWGQFNKGWGQCPEPAEREGCMGEGCVGEGRGAACPSPPRLGDPGTNTPPSLLPLAKPPVGQTQEGCQHAEHEGACGQAQGRPSGAGLPPPPRHSFSPFIMCLSSMHSFVRGWGFADVSPGWFREKSGACKTLTCSHTRRGCCSCSTRRTSSPCGRL